MFVCGELRMAGNCNVSTAVMVLFVSGSLAEHVLVIRTISHRRHVP